MKEGVEQIYGSFTKYKNKPQMYILLGEEHQQLPVKMR